MVKTGQATVETAQTKAWSATELEEPPSAEEAETTEPESPVYQPILEPTLEEPPEETQPVSEMDDVPAEEESAPSKPEAPAAE